MNELEREIIQMRESPEKFATDVKGKKRERENSVLEVTIMRVDSMLQTSQVYKANSAKKYNAASSVMTFNDSVEISQLGKDYQIAKQAVKAAPDVREDKVAAVKAAFENGTYSVSDSELADKLLENFDI